MNRGDLWYIQTQPKDDTKPVDIMFVNVRSVFEYIGQNRDGQQCHKINRGTSHDCSFPTQIDVADPATEEGEDGCTSIVPSSTNRMEYRLRSCVTEKI